MLLSRSPRSQATTGTMSRRTYPPYTTVRITAVHSSIIRQQYHHELPSSSACVSVSLHHGAVNARLGHGQFSISHVQEWKRLEQTAFVAVSNAIGQTSKCMSQLMRRATRPDRLKCSVNQAATSLPPQRERASTLLKVEECSSLSWTVRALIVIFAHWNQTRRS